MTLRSRATEPTRAQYERVCEMAAWAYTCHLRGLNTKGKSWASINNLARALGACGFDVEKPHPSPRAPGSGGAS